MRYVRRLQSIKETRLPVLNGECGAALGNSGSICPLNHAARRCRGTLLRGDPGVVRAAAGPRARSAVAATSAAPAGARERAASCKSAPTDCPGARAGTPGTTRGSIARSDVAAASRPGAVLRYAFCRRPERMTVPAQPQDEAAALIDPRQQQRVTVVAVKTSSTPRKIIAFSLTTCGSSMPQGRSSIGTTRRSRRSA